MSDLTVTVIGGVVLLIVSSFVSLAVWAVNAKIKESALRQENAMLQLEAKITREYIEPAIAELRGMVARLEERIEILTEMRDGFTSLHQAMNQRDVSLVQPTRNT